MNETWLCHEIDINWQFNRGKIARQWEQDPTTSTSSLIECVEKKGVDSLELQVYAVYYAVRGNQTIKSQVGERDRG